MSVVLLLAGAEVLVHLLVSEETFWPISTIYRRVEHPGVGYTFRPGFSGTAFGVGLEINRAGFRGGEWSRRRPSDVQLRIALLGDSFAFGYGVEFEDSVGEQLERSLARREGIGAEVLGFGVNGYNSRQQQALLQRMVLDYEPDLAIVLITNNDHEPSMLVDADGWLHWDGSERRRTRVVDRSIERIRIESPDWLTRHSRLVLYLRVLAQRASLAAMDREALGSEEAEDWTQTVRAGPIAGCSRA